MNRENRRRRGPDEGAEESTAAMATTTVVDRPRTPPGEFLKEVRSEMRKVAWPTRREVISYTIVVLVTTLVLTLLSWGLDQIFSNAVINFFG